MHLLMATLVASLIGLGLSTSRVHGQQAQPASRAASPVAVIDIGHIFKNHVRFKQTMEAMQKEVQAAEEALNKERQAIQAMIEQQKGLKSDHPDYKRLEDQIVDAQSRWTAEATKQKKDFLEREAKIYHQVYQEINQAVKLFCDHYGISIVLRYSNEEVQSGDRNSVLKAVNRMVVYLGPNMDITQPILAELNRGAATATAPAGVRQTQTPVRGFAPTQTR